jgi:hypothetical protein
MRGSDERLSCRIYREKNRNTSETEVPKVPKGQFEGKKEVE